MKSRDELAEMFAVAIVTSSGPDGELWWEDAMRDAFNAADTFVAERERRAGTPAEPVAPTGGGVEPPMCAMCERPAGHTDHLVGDWEEGWLCCGALTCCDRGTGWTHFPLPASEKPLARAPLAPEKPPAFVDEARPLTPESIAAVEAHARSRPPLPVIQTKPHDPARGCVGCEHLAKGVCHDPTLLAPVTMLDAVLQPRAPYWCPKRAKPEALRFGDDGALLNADGDDADTAADGYAGWVLTDEVAVYFKPKDRAHAERVMAAALAAGRGVK